MQVRQLWKDCNVGVSPVRITVQDEPTGLDVGGAAIDAATFAAAAAAAAAAPTTGSGMHLHFIFGISPAPQSQ